MDRFPFLGIPVLVGTPLVGIRSDIFGSRCGYDNRTDMTDRSISPTELAYHDGYRGRRKYVAYNGVVYDVTDCPRWRTAMHEQLHWPGQDLTTELPEAPHDAAVFERPCVKRMGVLQQD